MTISGATRTDLGDILRSQQAYRSLVWAIRFSVVALTLCVFTAITGADALILIGLACPVVSLLLLLAIMVAVVASQARPQLPDDSLTAQVQLPIDIIGLAARDAVVGVPRDRQ